MEAGMTQEQWLRIARHRKRDRRKTQGTAPLAMAGRGCRGVALMMWLGVSLAVMAVALSVSMAEASMWERSSKVSLGDDRLNGPARLDRARRFVITSLGRSGSTYLVSMLGSHPDMRVYSEVFNPNGQYCHYHALNPGRNKRMARDYLNMFFETRFCEMGFCQYRSCERSTPPCQSCPKALREKPRTVGLKLLMGQQLSEAAPALQGARVIVLFRRHIIMRAMSALHLAQDKVATTKVHNANVTDILKPLVVDPVTAWQAVAKHIHMEDALRKKVLTISQAYLPVWYEDLAAAAEQREWSSGPWYAITQFLGVRPQPLTTKLVKMHREDLTHRLYPNLDEVVSYIRMRLGLEPQASSM